jgi:hypothetical protein
MNRDEKKKEKKSHSQNGNIRKRGRSWKGQNAEVEEDLKIIGIRN